MINLPVNVDKARLPAAYERAKMDLAECEKIDECMTWADKAAALASYAKQAKDETLAKHCRRIQSRAIRRAGELLKEVEPDKGGPRTVLNKNTVTRGSAARAAGLNVNRQVRAVAMASIPAEEFEQLVESDQPPRVEQLARMGMKKRAPSAAVTARGWLNRAVIAAIDARSEPAESCPNTDEMRDAIQDVIAAWSEVLRHLNTK